MKIQMLVIKNILVLLLLLVLLLPSIDGISTSQVQRFLNINKRLGEVWVGCGRDARLSGTLESLVVDLTDLGMDVLQLLAVKSSEKEDLTYTAFLKQILLLMRYFEGGPFRKCQLRNVKILSDLMEIDAKLAEEYNQLISSLIIATMEQSSAMSVTLDFTKMSSEELAERLKELSANIDHFMFLTDSIVKKSINEDLAFMVQFKMTLETMTSLAHKISRIVSNRAEGESFFDQTTFNKKLSKIIIPALHFMQKSLIQSKYHTTSALLPLYHSNPTKYRIDISHDSATLTGLRKWIDRIFLVVQSAGKKSLEDIRWISLQINIASFYIIKESDGSVEEMASISEARTAMSNIKSHIFNLMKHRDRKTPFVVELEGIQQLSASVYCQLLITKMKKQLEMVIDEEDRVEELIQGYELFYDNCQSNAGIINSLWYFYQKVQETLGEWPFFAPPRLLTKRIDLFGLYLDNIIHVNSNNNNNNNRIAEESAALELEGFGNDSDEEEDESEVQRNLIEEALEEVKRFAHLTLDIILEYSRSLAEGQHILRIPNLSYLADKVAKVVQLAQLHDQPLSPSQSLLLLEHLKAVKDKIHLMAIRPFYIDRGAQHYRDLERGIEKIFLKGGFPIVISGSFTQEATDISHLIMQYNMKSEINGMEEGEHLLAVRFNILERLEQLKKIISITNAMKVQLLWTEELEMYDSLTIFFSHFVKEVDGLIYSHRILLRGTRRIHFDYLIKKYKLDQTKYTYVISKMQPQRSSSLRTSHSRSDFPSFGSF